MLSDQELLSPLLIWTHQTNATPRLTRDLHSPLMRLSGMSLCINMYRYTYSVTPRWHRQLPASAPCTDIHISLCQPVMSTGRNLQLLLFHFQPHFNTDAKQTGVLQGACKEGLAYVNLCRYGTLVIQVRETEEKDSQEQP